MAGKKVKNEVEGIRNELQNLSEAVWALREHVTIQTAAAAAASSTGRSPNGVLVASSVANIAADLDVAGAARGAVVTRGVVRNAAGDREYRWDFEANAGDLLAVDDEQASRLLAAISHRQRLAILKLILDQPTTAAELVSTLDLGTTGAAYHHLNVLQSADLVTQEGRGVFVVQPHRVSAIFSILAGIESVASASVTEVAKDDGAPDEAELAEANSGGKRKGKKPA